MTINILTGQGTWSLAAADFVNPSYLNIPVGGRALSPSAGFDITGCGSVLIYFAGTYTGATVAHEQTLDSTGATGWFAVQGSPTTGAAASTTGATSGLAYVFPSVGVRQRIKLTALSTGTITVQVGTTIEVLSASGGGGGGGGGGAVTIADGADVAQGSIADATVASGASGTVESYLRTLKDAALSTTPSPVTGAGTAGSPDPNILTAQGMAGMVPLRTAEAVPFGGTIARGIITSAMTGTTSTAVAGMGAPGANLYNYITELSVSNSHATVGTDVELQDGNGGTTFWIVPAAAVYGGATLHFSPPLRQPTVDTALYAKNATTGASVRLTTNGYTAPV